MLQITRVLFVLLLLLAGCASADSTPEIIEVVRDVAEVVPTATATKIPATATVTLALPTQTPRPTWTVIATNTPVVKTASPSATTAVIEATGLPPETPTELPTEIVVVATATIEATAAPFSTPVPATLAPTATTAATPLPTISASATPSPLPATATTVATATNIPATATATLLPTEPPPPQPVFTNIGDIGALPADTEVTISGNVVWSASFAKGFKLTVQDATGRVTLLLWHNVYDECWDKNVLNVGATVVATGNTGNFEGELQVVPWWGGGVDVTAPAYAYATPRKAAELGQFIGERAMVEGNVTRVDVMEQFTKIYVDDGSAEIEIFLWSNVWVRVPNKDAIAAGSHLKVVGVVGEFRGTIQLVPPLPTDVVQ